MSITGGITTMTTGVSIVGVIDGTTATIGRVATAGAIVADRKSGSAESTTASDFTRGHIRVA
jgi:hypothetical protein